MLKKMINHLVCFGLILVLLTPATVYAERARVVIQELSVNPAIGKHAQKQLDQDLLLQEIETAVQQTNKFIVLGRQSEILKAVRDEQKFAKTRFTTGDAAFENEMSNADYIVFTKVMGFSFYRDLKPISNLPGKYRFQDKGDLKLTVKVVDTTTAQIKANFPLKIAFGTKLKVTSKKDKIPSKFHYENMVRKVSVQLADKLTDRVFPMKVLKSKGSTVWINRGQDGGLKPGQTLRAYSPGEMLIDPDTGENLGSAEEYIGTVKINEVKPKFSTAIINKTGVAGSIGVGTIIRKSE